MLPNAFIGKTKKPTTKELSDVLGPARSLWDDLLEQLADGLGVNGEEWNSYSKKAGWSLKVKRGERTILYMIPCSGSFRIAFVLGDKAIKAALQSDPPQRMIQIIKEGKRYPEGTGITLEMVTAKDVPIIKKLAAAKLGN